MRTMKGWTSMNNTIDVSPAILDLVLYAGDGTSFQVKFIDENDVITDVSDLVWTAQIRKTRTTDIAADLEIDTTNASTGIIIVHIPADVTRTLAKKSQWDLQSTSSSDSEPLTILQGTVSCNLDVTREVVTP